jgi:hypothetical protein
VRRPRRRHGLGCGAVGRSRANSQPGRALRANWEDGSTRVNVTFTALGDAKSQAALQHERLPDAETADRLKAFWRERVAVLKQVLEA